MSTKEDNSLLKVLAENALSAEVLGKPGHPEHERQRQAFVRLLDDGKITIASLEALAKVLPSALEKIGAISSDARTSQVEALRALRESNEQDFLVLEKIIQSAESEDLRREALQAAERMSAGKKEAVKNISSENNSFFKYATGVILGGLFLVGAGAAAAKALTK